MNGEFGKVTWPQFKEMAAEFFRRLPGCQRVEQVDAGHKCLIMAYTNLEASELDQHQARLVLDIAAKKGGKRERDLLFAGLKA